MNKLKITEVGPRDGFQNICSYIEPDRKKEIIGGIADAGVKRIQVTSFVSPKAVPQMQDAAQVAAYCLDRYPQVTFSALVPNLRGAEGAYQCGIREISYVVSLSETHNQANVKSTHEKSFLELERIMNAYPQMKICLDLATSFGCPFEGKKTAGDVTEFLEKWIRLGVQTVNLCDTIGIANPRQVRETIGAVRRKYPETELFVHIHDTRNMGMVNTLAAIECGADGVQSTLGGLGGCPFAPGASGNLATEDLVFMLTEMGYETGIDWQLLTEAARLERKLIPGGNYSGHLMNIEAH